MSSRNADRRDHDDRTRIVLLEKDVDDISGDLVELRMSTQRMVGIMMGILVSTATAAILLALNLVVGR